MSMFGLDHLSPLTPQDVTAGPSVGWGEAIRQGYEQQTRVDSPLSLEYELQQSWLENIERLQNKTGETFEMPENLSDYQTFMRQLAGEQAEFSTATSYESPEERLAMFQRAQQRIKELNDPEVKSFENVLQDVFNMQQEVEGRSQELSERGDWLGQLIGAIGGSFTTRDPLSLYTLTIGGEGRVIATRILSEMAVGAAVAGASDVAFVNPNRARGGLPERDPLYDMAAAAIGAGAFRLGFGEPLRLAGRALKGEFGPDVSLDFRDDVLRSVFETNDTSPRARAGASMLDDIQFVEKNNPYGAGDAANARFLAELQDVQRVMGGEPQTAVARVLPPVPFEYIKDAADFQIVKQQSPEVYARLEEAQASVRRLENEIVSASEGLPKLDFKRDNPGGEWLARKVTQAEEGYAPWRKGIEAKGLSGSTTGYSRVNLPVSMLRDLRGVNNEDVRASGKLDSIASSIRESGYDPKSRVMVWVNHKGEAYLYEGNHRVAAAADTGISDIPVEVQWRNGAEDVVSDFSPDNLRQFGEITVDKKAIVGLRAERRAANRAYHDAYAKVEAEAERLRRAQAAIRGVQQADAVDLLGNSMGGRRVPVLQYDHTAALVEEINRFNDTLDEKSLRLFQDQEPEPRAEGAEPEEPKPVYDLGDGRIDIGLREPVDADFKFVTDDGEFTVKETMDDLDDDVALEEAMRSCLL